jgi:hypothetical protein
MVCEELIKLKKCAGTHNVADALTKSLPAPAFYKHRPWLTGTLQEYKAFSVKMGVTLPHPCVAAAA